MDMAPSSSLTSSINILHGFSLFIALLILIISIHDCGIFSLCMNPLFAIITIGYHTTMLSLAYKKPDDAPILPVGYIITPYILTSAWFGAYIAMSLVLSSRQRAIRVLDIQILVPRKLWVHQKIQMMLDPVECFVIASIAIRSTIERRQLQCEEGKEPV